ncbi:LOW QUALITY PROTEIN: E3 ubiquitin-protein ligase TRIM69-like [Rhinoraja longicauda]
MKIEAAVEIYKAQVKSTFESLGRKDAVIWQKERGQKDSISQIKEESHNLQSQITSQFAELHQILTEKEQCLLGEIQEEGKKLVKAMEKNLQEIQENLKSIREELSKLQEQIYQKDGVIFLKEVAGRKTRFSDEAKPMVVEHYTLPIETFDRTFFYNMALRETSGFIKRVSVTLDVETAGPELEVSEDRKRMRWTETWRSLPDTGKRFTGRACVLGSEGFTSGRHYWEVEVAGCGDWGLGVAAESVARKGRVTSTPETGIWCIRRQDDDFDALTSPPFRLSARPIPGRVGVYLSYESGTVSFYDADTKSHLHTFTGNKFMEKLYPFFWTLEEDQWLRICSGFAPGQEIQENLKSIQEEISKLQEQIDHKDCVIILKEVADRKTRFSDEAKPMLVVGGKLPNEKFDHTFFYNKALRETSDIIKRVSVTLDVETASPELGVSEDRKSVRWTRTRRSLPDTGKRFTGRECVLGSEGFTSGRHYWEVEVAGSVGWSLGVTAESVERKGEDELTPETGVWSIRRWNDQFDAVTSPPSPLPARPIPGRVGVYLSYESGTVSFYDADTKSHLHTFAGNKFTEKLYPFFWILEKDHWLRICSGSAPGV